MNPKKRLLEPKETSPFAYLITFFRKLCPFSPFLNHLLKFSKNNRGRVISAMTFPLLGNFNHFCQLTQPLHSANAATSFYQIKCLIRATNTPLQANEVESSSQRSHIFEPTQSYLQVSAVISSSQRSHIFEPAETSDFFIKPRLKTSDFFMF